MFQILTMKQAGFRNAFPHHFLRRIATLTFLIVAAFVPQALTEQQVKGDEVSRPNVILILTDDQGYGDLACHGNPFLNTPHLDQLHAESVRLTDFHVSPFCTPTRAALMTGNYPAVTGAYRTSSGRTMMHRDELTVGNLFADNGYATGMIGKWHLGDNAPHRPQDRGFQEVVWHRCGGIGQASDYWGNDYFDDVYERNGKFEKFDGYCTDVWFREATRFIEKHQKEPFFLYLALNAPHGPYRVPAKWAKPYAGNKKITNANFFGMIANIDYNVGALRKRLKELSLEKDTILIFMTDNGTAAGAKFDGLDSAPLLGFNAGMRGKKSSVYDGGHRVPCFIHWPAGGLTGGKDVAGQTAHIDMLPTLAELCGIRVPEGYAPDGVSLKGLLTENKPLQRSHIVVQFHGGAGGTGLPAQPFKWSAVLTPRWRLVNSGQQSLYDIEADPGQTTDLSAKHPEVVAGLRSHYMKFWKKVSPRLKPVRIDIGNPGESPTRLCSQDWYMPTGNPPWNFYTIGRLPPVTGPWMLHVVKTGRYRITLRQFPVEAQKPVVAAMAALEIGGVKSKSAVKPGSLGVEFVVKLSQGPTQLNTWLTRQNGEAGGAYFADVEYLGE